MTLKYMITGHRPQGLGGFRDNPIQERCKEWIDEKIREIVKADPNPQFISGMAIGVDTWWAEAALRKGLDVLAYVPFEGQEGRWPPRVQKRYHQILELAEVRYVCDPGYAGWKMFRRNEAMIEDADRCFAIWNGKRQGGTYQCIEHILKAGKPLETFNPFEDDE